LLRMAVGALIVMACMAIFSAKLIEKTNTNIKSGNLSSLRVEISHTATEIWKHHTLSGVGPANFSATSPAQIEHWILARGESYVPSFYYYSSHAHNLFFNTLAERGLIGITVLIGLCGAWLFALYKHRPTERIEERPLAWAGWGAGWAGWCLVFIGGLFNTTLHHEHGMLAMMCLGTFLSAASNSRTHLA
jgi:O-antigen ligase